MTTSPNPAILEALDASDAPALLQIIKQSPTWDNVNDLAYAFLELAQRRPGDVDRIADTMLAVTSSPDARTIKLRDGNGEQMELRDLLTHELYEMLDSAFDYAYEDIETINEECPILIAAMISGACARTKLTNSATQTSLVTRGLHFSKSGYEDHITPEQYECNALHACIQLLVGGAVGYETGQTRYDKEDLLPALRAIEEKDIIKYENGKRLLKLTIEQAEKEFKDNLSSMEIWKFLFPDSESSKEKCNTN